MFNWRGYICPQYMCILLYVTHIWCSGIPYIYGQLEGGTSALTICAFCYMWKLFGVVVFHKSMVNWRKEGLGICAFCSMWNFCGVAVFHTSMVSWRGYICPKYMCILLYVTHIWCSGIPYIYGQLEGGTSALSISAFCFMWKLFGVVVFHKSMVNWRKEGLGICAFCSMWNFCGVVVFHTSMVNCKGYICPQYMCILLYVKHIWCSGIL